MFDVQTQNLEPGTPNLVLRRAADLFEAAGDVFYATANIAVQYTFRRRFRALIPGAFFPVLSDFRGEA